MRRLLIGIPYWLGLPVLVTLAGYLPAGLAGPSTLPMLYLTALLVCSLKTRPVGLMLSAVLSFFLLRYFHTEPRYSLHVADPGELVSGMLFVVFAMRNGCGPWSTMCRDRRAYWWNASTMSHVGWRPTWPISSG